MDTSGLNRFDWLIIWFLPHTEAIKPEVGICWLSLRLRLLVLFYALPTGIMALFGIVAAVATSSITMVQALGGMQRLMCGLS